MYPEYFVYISSILFLVLIVFFESAENDFIGVNMPERIAIVLNFINLQVYSLTQTYRPDNKFRFLDQRSLFSTLVQMDASLEDFSVATLVMFSGPIQQ